MATGGLMPQKIVYHEETGKAAVLCSGKIPEGYTEKRPVIQTTVEPQASTPKLITDKE
jgi:hypothetical protein